MGFWSTTYFFALAFSASIAIVAADQRGTRWSALLLILSFIFTRMIVEYSPLHLQPYIFTMADTLIAVAILKISGFSLIGRSLAALYALMIIGYAIAAIENSLYTAVLAYVDLLAFIQLMIILGGCRGTITRLGSSFLDWSGVHSPRRHAVMEDLQAGKALQNGKTSTTIHNEASG